MTVQMPRDMTLNCGLLFSPLPNTPHLDPLPSSDEGRGNPVAFVVRTPISVCECDAPFPLPFRRGEDQGEGLLRKIFVSLANWTSILALSHARRETFAQSYRRK